MANRSYSADEQWLLARQRSSFRAGCHLRHSRMHTLTVSRDTSRPAKYSIFLSLGCHIECQDSRLGPTARLLHLCRLGLDGDVPDHSTFSKNRHGRFRASDLLRHAFESIVQRCLAEGLVGADGFAVDASLIAADANKQRSVASKDWKPEE